MIERVIRERGPLTVAAFMDLALYHPELGYYARSEQRSGRTGDFFTSVDVGPLFGDLLAVQIAEMAGLLADAGLKVGTTSEGITSTGEIAETNHQSLSANAACSAVKRGGLHDARTPAPFDLVEAGAGNGRLAADVLGALRRRHLDLYARTRLHLVESSGAAREAQRSTLGAVSDRLVWSDARLPTSFEGVLFANELLDAMPVHQVVMRRDGLREVYVAAGPREQECRLALTEGPLSDPALADYLDRRGITLERGWRVEINLRAIEWVREAARTLRRGFIILIDYGHEARELYSVTHASGTLSSFARHTSAGAESAVIPWLERPGDQDITAHVDFTSVRAAAEAEGLTTLGFLDQTYFLLGLLGVAKRASAKGNPPSPLNLESLENPANLSARLALKTLLLPGGLGSTLKVLVLGKGVGAPLLRGCSYRMRVT